MKAIEKKAFLILEDGHVYSGTAIGADRECISEIVFNTAMAGHLEVLTDPAYAGQAVVLTYPLLGNYGVNKEDMESNRVWTDGLIVRELSRIHSNFRSEGSIQDFLEEYNVPGIAGVDTRALTKLLRAKGSMKGMITRNENFVLEEVLEQIAAHKVNGLVQETTCKEISVLPGEGHKVAVLDLGTKKSMVAELNKMGCEVTVYPANTAAETILAADPDGIFISNGPGDPKECMDIVAEVRKLYASDKPILAIGLGHLLMALANGIDTYKMKYGHHGGHAVKDMNNGRAYISSQNHDYVVDIRNLDPAMAVPAFTNVNDGTDEGLAYVGKNILTAQAYPETAPSPVDSANLFDRFILMMEKGGAHNA